MTIQRLADWIKAQYRRARDTGHIIDRQGKRIPIPPSPPPPTPTYYGETPLPGQFNTDTPLEYRPIVKNPWDILDPEETTQAPPEPPSKPFPPMTFHKTPKPPANYRPGPNPFLASVPTGVAYSLSYPRADPEPKEDQEGLITVERLDSSPLTPEQERLIEQAFNIARPSNEELPPQ